MLIEQFNAGSDVERHKNNSEVSTLKIGTVIPGLAKSSYNPNEHFGQPNIKRNQVWGFDYGLAFRRFENEDLVEHQNMNSQLSKRNMIRMSRRVFFPLYFLKFILFLKDKWFIKICKQYKSSERKVSLRYTSCI